MSPITSLSVIILFSIKHIDIDFSINHQQLLKMKSLSTIYCLINFLDLSTTAFKKQLYIPFFVEFTKVFDHNIIITKAFKLGRNRNYLRTVCLHSSMPTGCSDIEEATSSFQQIICRVTKGMRIRATLLSYSN